MAHKVDPRLEALREMSRKTDASGITIKNLKMSRPYQGPEKTMKQKRTLSTFLEKLVSLVG